MRGTGGPCCVRCVVSAVLCVISSHRGSGRTGLGGGVPGSRRRPQRGSRPRLRAACAGGEGEKGGWSGQTRGMGGEGEESWEDSPFSTRCKAARLAARFSSDQSWVWCHNERSTSHWTVELSLKEEEEVPPD